MSSRRRTILSGLLVTVIGALLVPAVPAVAADDDPDLRVSIRSLSPSRLAPGSGITMTGTVSNRDDHAWGKMQAYLVIPAAPFTTRAQVAEAVSNPAAYTGVRVVDVGTFDEMGDLAPGQTQPFRITVPADQLDITGDEGIYPVGVQILATDVDGSRSPDAIARATTFVPLIDAGQDPVPTSILWPFLMPDHADADGTYAEPRELLASVSDGGQLRNLLDLASSSSGNAATALVDPALLTGVDDLANGRHLAEDVELDDADRASAALFLRDLLAFARRGAWIIDYDRPDVLAFDRNPDLQAPLQAAASRATDSVLTQYQLSGRRVTWPSRDGVTRSLLASVRGNGDAPVIVTPASVPDWQPRLGSLVQYESRRGPVPLLVNDAPTGGGSESVLALRQRILTDAALAVLERGADGSSRADSFTMIDPAWDPGARWSTGQLSAAFSAPFTRTMNLDALLTRSPAAYKGQVPATAKARPISRSQLERATEIVTKGATLTSIISRSDGVDTALDRAVASVLGVRWRQDRAEAFRIATSRARLTGAELDKISIESPPSVTLSSSKGGFPLTIRNETDQDIRIGVDLDSSNPALTIPAVDAVEVGAGERHTLTVQIDLGRQRATDLTARLVSPGGTEVGTSATFRVRSSRIGVVLWVAMGLAGLFVLATLVRRFHRRRTGTSSERLADDDD